MKFPFWPNPSGYRDIELGLSRVYQLLERLGNPHLQLPPTIHIAGTNGKGSTQAFLRAIFEEAELKIHSYTSPHLVNFNERIILAGHEISDDYLNEILRECKIAAEKIPAIPVTFFEGITVAAFLAFSRVKADLLLLEVGMGGRLDATNVLPEVLCSIITPIAFDHEEFLGNSLEKIAFEKAGIIKKNCPVIIGDQNLEALHTVENQARTMNAEIFNFDKNFLDFEVSLEGNHQHKNAATAATAAISQKKFSITLEQIKRALKKAKWPARLQKITSGKFFEMAKSCELYLDGSHNPQGATTIVDFLKNKKNTHKTNTSFLNASAFKNLIKGSSVASQPRMTDVEKKVSVIFGMLKDKNCEEFLKIISPEVSELIAIEIPNESKSRSAAEIFDIAQKLKIKSQTAKNLEEAFTKIKCHESAIILVCGSLYLAGSFLEMNSEKK